MREQFPPKPLGIGKKCIRSGSCILRAGGFQAFCQHAHAVELTQRSDNFHGPISTGWLLCADGQ
jgi:hypothetical protein